MFTGHSLSLFFFVIAVNRCCCCLCLCSCFYLCSSCESYYCRLLLLFLLVGAPEGISYFLWFMVSFLCQTQIQLRLWQLIFKLFACFKVGAGTWLSLCKNGIINKKLRRKTQFAYNQPSYKLLTWLLGEESEIRLENKVVSLLLWMNVIRLIKTSKYVHSCVRQTNS